MSLIKLEGHFQIQYGLCLRSQFQLEQKMILFLYLSPQWFEYPHTNKWDKELQSQQKAEKFRSHHFFYQ